MNEVNQFVNMSVIIPNLVRQTQFLHCHYTPKVWDKSNPWTKLLGPLDLGLVQLGLHWCNPWTSYLLGQMYMGTVGD